MESSKSKLFTCIPRNKRFCEHRGTKLKIVSKNALPILAYYDIFKNYYANTQEENLYIIGNTEELTITINGTEVNPNIIPSNEGRVNNTGVITIAPNTIKQNEVQLKVTKELFELDSNNMNWLRSEVKPQVQELLRKQLGII